jgi:signal transduction histidine kinase
MNISDRKRVEQLKQDFVAMISHELRTPLTSMQAMLTLLANGAYGEITESGEKRLKSAKTGVNRLIMLINDLLDTEKLEAGKLSMTYKDVDLYNVVERSVETIEGFAEEHDVKVKVSNKPITVLGDSDRLIQVMVNLLSNAIKYSQEDGEIEVNIEADEEECEVHIVDHGAGIPPGFEDKIFQRYEQAPSVDGKRRGGTGLGLPICKAIVEQHGGTIGVKQTGGGGSTFWFRIPRVGGSAEA